MGLAQKVVPVGTRRRKWAASLVRAVRGPVRPENLSQEGKTLKRSWAKHDPKNLSEYLVTGYQNPRINAQSMLTRHFLVRELFGSDFDGLAREELEHCVRATEALRVRAKELGVKLRTSMNEEKRAEVRKVCQVIADWEDTYEKRWAKELEGRLGGPLSVLEFACGSANDYRFFDSYGIARFLYYTGVDLNDANVRNARNWFPEVDFQVGSVLDLPYGDASYDCVIASDIFEHLSPDAMEQAVGEACRIARKAMAFTFFSMVDEPEHEIRPVRSYYWNRLSADRMRELIERQFGPVEVIKIRDLLRDEFGYRHSYNKNAWTMIARRSAEATEA